MKIRAKGYLYIMYKHQTLFEAVTECKLPSIFDIDELMSITDTNIQIQSKRGNVWYIPIDFVKNFEAQYVRPSVYNKSA